MTTNILTFGELFAGIGGIGLGLERTGGFKCAWQVERDDYALKVLKKNWPDVPRCNDVCTFPPESGAWSCDLICGGFPCQDISLAGKGAGLEGSRSGLFYEAIRIFDTLRPRWVLLENVAALLIRGIDGVLGELAALGYDAEWHCLPASAVGARHRRDRVFILGYLADPVRARLQGHRETGETRQAGLQMALSLYRGGEGRRTWGTQCRLGIHTDGISGGLDGDRCGGWECGIPRVITGQANRPQRIKALGNAVVPQVAQFIGELILERNAEIFGENEP